MDISTYIMIASLILLTLFQIFSGKSDQAGEAIGLGLYVLFCCAVVVIWAAWQLAWEVGEWIFA